MSRRRASWPVRASHSRAVPSQDAVAIDVPSGEYATDVRRSVWPGSERTGFVVPSPGGFGGGPSGGFTAADGGGGSDTGSPVAARSPAASPATTTAAARIVVVLNAV